MEQNIFLPEYSQIMWCLCQQKKCTEYFSGTTRIESRKSNGMSEENIENMTKSDSNCTNFC